NAEVANNVSTSTRPPVPADKLIQNAVHDINMKAPTMIDAYTRLDKTSAGANLELIFDYTLVNVATAKQMPENIFKTAYEPTIKSTACASPEMMRFVDNNISIVYRYRGVDGSSIGSVEINRSECQPA
ncbi:MAG: hypothetical protein ACU84J_11395, partial [Gammaproteobacteria bacterium]